MNYLKLYGREEEFDITRRTSESFSKAVYDYVHENFDKSLFGMKGDYNYMLFTGGRFYIDGDSPEICTPPCMEKKGFVEDIVNATIAQRIVLLEGFRNLLKKSSSSVTLEGYSSHENVSYKCIYGRDQKLDKLIPYGRDLSDDTSFRTIMYSSIFRTIGPMLLLFFKNYYSQHGICYEDRSSNGSSRMQFNCEYTPDMDQLRAGIALLYASFRSIEKRVLENYDSSNPIETELSFYNLFPIIFKSKIGKKL